MAWPMTRRALLGRVFLISGVSTGAHEGCSGEIQVVIDDVNRC
jgi:hypothetical protein